MIFIFWYLASRWTGGPPLRFLSSVTSECKSFNLMSRHPDIQIQYLEDLRCSSKQRLRPSPSSALWLIIDLLLRTSLGGMETLAGGHRPAVSVWTDPNNLEYLKICGKVEPLSSQVGLSLVFFLLSFTILGPKILKPDILLWMFSPSTEAKEHTTNLLATCNCVAHCLEGETQGPGSQLFWVSSQRSSPQPPFCAFWDALSGYSVRSLLPTGLPPWAKFLVARDGEGHLRVCGRIPCLLVLQDITRPRIASASACPKITLGYKTIVATVDRLSRVLCSVGMPLLANPWQRLCWYPLGATVLL